MPFQLAVVFNHIEIAPYLVPQNEAAKNTEDLWGSEQLAIKKPNRKHPGVEKKQGTQDNSEDNIKEDWDAPSSSLISDPHPQMPKVSEVDYLLIEVLGRDGLHDQK